MKTRPRDAFRICHEIYEAARELVDNRLPTSQMESSSKFLWRPDLRPRMVEYVADFALCGERALDGFRSERAAETPEGPERVHAQSPESHAPRVRVQSSRRSSRLIFFRMHYLGGADYQAARRLLGLSEITCADWVDEIQERVGRELQRSKVFPPGRYFRVLSSLQ